MRKFEYILIAVLMGIACAYPFFCMDKDVPFQTVSNIMISNLSDKEVKKEDELFLRRTYHIVKRDYENGFVYSSRQAMGAEEVAVFYVSDENKRKQIHKQVEKRRKAQIDSFKGYGIEQTKLLQQSVILEKGNYIIYIVHKDAKKIVQALEDAF